MAERILVFLAEASAGAALLIAALLILRRLFRKRVSPRLIYALWLVAAARLFVPFYAPVPFSLAEQARPAVYQMVYGSGAVGSAELPGGRPVGEELWVNEGLSGADAESPQTALRPSGDAASVPEAHGDASAPWDGFDISALLLFIWAGGALTAAAVMICRNVRAALGLKRCGNGRLKDDIRTMHRELCAQAGCPELPLQIVSALPSPCLFGVLRPKIVIPARVAEDRELLSWAIRHELEHYRQRDCIWNVLRLVCCAVYWFHPLVWVGARASAQDCELSCDARVLRAAGSEELRYSHALLRILAMGRQSGAAISGGGIISMSCSKQNMKVRLDLIMNRQRRAIAAALLLVMLFAIAGCAAASATGAPKATESINAPTPADTEGADIVQGEVAYIELFDGTGSPDAPCTRWSSDGDVSELVGWLRGIETGAYLGGDAPGGSAPGDGRTYRLYPFDGEPVSIHFSGSGVSMGEGYYAYTSTYDPKLGGDVYLTVTGADSASVRYSIVNQSGEDRLTADTPRLQRMTAEGWTDMEAKAGFCGTKLPLPQGSLEGSILPDMFDGASAGTYRLMLPVWKAEEPEQVIENGLIKSVYTDDPYGEPTYVCDVFTIRAEAQPQAPASTTAPVPTDEPRAEPSAEREPSPTEKPAETPRPAEQPTTAPKPTAAPKLTTAPTPTAAPKLTTAPKPATAPTPTAAPM